MTDDFAEIRRQLDEDRAAVQRASRTLRRITRTLRRSRQVRREVVGTKQVHRSA